ncbi:hypothetical protein HD806DRAFT_544550 [Xylariaceae sp. AK1471]|nr:hypothetical protein HD806DRAFT_544550 [Xylariaceae sp. AK1471]
MAAPSTNNHAATMQKTIQSYGLIREPTVWEPKDTAFIDPYLMLASPRYNSLSPSASAPEWKSFKITQSCPSSSSPKLLNGYAVSPSHHAYVTFCVKLTATDAARDPVRLTEMRYRDMIVDNYISACINSPTSTSKLRWLGIANILNKPSRSTFHQVFHLAGRDILSRGNVEVHPSLLHDKNEKYERQTRDLLFNDPFTRGVLALLHHRARDMGYAFVKRFIFISEGYEGREFSGQPSPLELRLNLVVELARPGDDDVGDEITGVSPLANL